MRGPDRRRPRPSVALLDYEVTEQSPAGSCHLRLLEELHHEVDFTVFANEFDNPNPSRIRWIRVPSVRRPMAARYITYYAASAIARRVAGPFDVVQAIEGYTDRCDISYVHFCHRHYLRRSGQSRARSTRERVRRLDHRLRSFGERAALTRPRVVVVPSAALRDEIVETYGLDSRRIHVIPNPVDPTRWKPPSRLDRQALRSGLGFQDDHVVAVFVALGHFERKGLPLLLEALAAASPRLRLLVVGGTQDMLDAYSRRARDLGLQERVHWVGRQADIRPYLWAADLLAAPSAYETFGLALHQAAASGLPLLVHPLPGITDVFVRHRAAWTVPRQAEAMALALDRIADMSPSDRRTMGDRARAAAVGAGPGSFADQWREIYRHLLADAGRRAASLDPMVDEHRAKGRPA